MITFEDPGVIAIVRLRHTAAPDQLYDALIDAGIRSIEVTLPTPDSAITISRWRKRGIGMVGAGTVRTVDDVTRADDAGAQFLVTPTTSVPVLQAAQARALPVVCGALTASEIDTAAGFGAACVKVFPIDTVGGLTYLKGIAAPLDDIRFVPTGGVDSDSAGKYAAFGCAGVGIGSALVDETTVAAGDWRTIQDRARRIVEAWNEGMAQRA